MMFNFYYIKLKTALLAKMKKTNINQNRLTVTYNNKL